MVNASMFELAKSNVLGPLRRGLRRSDLRSYLGPPPMWLLPSPQNSAKIWRYGSIEFYFEADRLSHIFCDQDDLTDGGLTLQIDPWIIKRGRPRAEIEYEFNDLGIMFRLTTPAYDLNQCHVITESGTVFAFIEKLGEGYDETGLVYWSTRNSA